MQPTLDEIGVNLLKQGYCKIAFLEVECIIDGTLRLGVSLDTLLGERYECPKCHALRPCSKILAIGYSRRLLEPELWCGPGHWHYVSDQEYRPTSRRRYGRAHHYRKTFQVGLRERAVSTNVHG